MSDDFRPALIEMIPHLRAFGRSLTGGDREFADDLVQDTLVKAMQAEGQFQQGTNLRAWLFTILRNTFCSQVGRRRRHVEMQDEDLERLATTAAPQEGRLEAIAFRRAFKQLSAVHREVLVLSVLQGMPYEAIAAQSGCEVGTVKSRVNRARAQLKAMLLDGELPVQPRRTAAAEGRTLDDSDAATVSADLVAGQAQAQRGGQRGSGQVATRQQSGPPSRH